MFESTRQSHERALAGLKKLESLLSFRLAVLQRLLDRQMGRILSRHGLSVAAYRIMVTVEAFGEMSASDLVRLVAVDKGLVSRSSADLVALGFLASRPDPLSGRRKLLSLTRQGAAKLDSMKPEIDARNAALDQLLSKQERATVDVVLEKLTTHALKSLEGGEPAQSAA